MPQPFISHRSVCHGDQLATVTTYQGAMSLRIHAMGFLEIAAVAARASLEHKTAIDAIAPSIIYAVRHGTELFLKHVVAELSEAYGSTPGEQNKRDTHHDLQKLWDDHRSMIVRALEYEANHAEHANFDRRAWLAEFGDIIGQVHQVDPDGQSVRYPTKLNGTENLGKKMVVSIEQLKRFADHAQACFSRFTERRC